jgi:N-acetylglutamate synthase-like GNAT family acetyltransferase
MAVAEATGGTASPCIGPAVRDALAPASERGAERAYLLTETVDGFFPRFGLRPIDRAEVPGDVRGSLEFVSTCRESARALTAELA